MISDFHIHTRFSGDSDELPENQIKKAISLGMKEICFTEHHDYGVVSDTDFTLDFVSYFSYMSALKDRYQDKINIRIGVELGLQCRIESYLKEIEHAYPFDFIIGSSHFVEGLDPYFPEFWQGREEKKALQDFFECSLKRVKLLDCFDSYGHLDYIVRYGANQNRNYKYSDHQEVIDEILKVLLKKGKALECNTGGFRYGLGQPNPCTDILKRYHELGGERITVGSDAHIAKNLGIAFPETHQLLKDLGFSYYLTFDNRKETAHPL